MSADATTGQPERELSEGQQIKFEHFEQYYEIALEKCAEEFARSHPWTRKDGQEQADFVADVANRCVHSACLFALSAVRTRMDILNTIRQPETADVSEEIGSEEGAVS